MFKLVLATFFWGSSYYLNKVALADMAVLDALSIRFLLSTIILAMFYIPSKHSKRDLKNMKNDAGLVFKVVLFSLLTISGHYYFMYDSLNYLDAGVAAILVEAGIPVSQFVVAVFLLKEKVTKIQILAIFTSILGLFLVSGIDIHSVLSYEEQGIGYVLVFASILCMTFSLFFSKKITNTISVLGLVFWSTFIGSLLFHVFSFSNISSFSIASISFGSWLTLIYLGIFSSGLAFIWYYGATKYYPTSTISSFLFLIPIWGVIVVFVFSDERFSSAQIIGMFVTLFSLWFILKKPKNV